MTVKVLANRDIKANKVLVIGTEGEKICVMDTKEAIAMAEKMGLDLVVVSHGKDMPTAKIMDANKYAYELKQKEKQKKKNSKVIEVKEIRFSPNIAEHDLEIKESAARKFLSAGHDVKFTLRCRGREISRISSLSSMLSDVAKDLEDCAAVKLGVQVNGRTASILLKPAVPFATSKNT